MLTHVHYAARAEKVKRFSESSAKIVMNGPAGPFPRARAAPGETARGHSEKLA